MSSTRPPKGRRRQILALLSILGASPGPPLPAEGPKPKVILTLECATAEWAEGGDVLFECRLTVENNTGAALIVRSHFYSAFDGMDLIVRDETGTWLKRQSYLDHQSPFSTLSRKFALPVGKTTRTVVFPVPGLPRAATMFKVQAVGTLPGSGFCQEIAPQVREVRVRAK